MRTGIAVARAVIVAVSLTGVSQPEGGPRAIAAPRNSADAIVAQFAAAGAVDKDFRAFWDAGSPRDAAKAADRLTRDGVDFDAAWQRLKQGRAYGRAPTGRRIERLRVGTDTFENAIEIPAGYDPARRWQVRVQLHGGINRPDPAEGVAPGRRQGAQNRLAGEDQIYLFPSGWADAAWWHPNQVENILTLLDQVKRRYNADESRVYVTGTSDGGTGVYYLALREATPWSACLPLIGSLRVLANPEVRADGELFAGNLANRPFFIVNAANDPLYPALVIEPYVEMMKRAGVQAVFHPQESGGHDTSWWPGERSAYEQFVHEHPRDPHPERLSWETERTDRANRIQWLVIDTLGAASSDVALEDVNAFSPYVADGRALKVGASQRFFARNTPSGRVDVVRRGNTVEAKTRGVRAFTLLLSPDVFDFAQPISLVVNGRPAEQRAIAKSADVLLKWAARDNDRTMLYGGELNVRVP
jgi:poly(3-hydroxybutyrate) depolymerase